MISRKFIARASFAALALAPLGLAACSSTGAPEAPAAAVVVGNTVAGAAVAAPSVPAPVAKPVEPVPDGVLAGPLGGKLNEADRKGAFAAQLAALSTGQKKTWRGAGGTYGFIEPGAESPSLKGSCRAYSHTIFFNGRPQSASGQSCREADGTWRSA